MTNPRNGGKVLGTLALIIASVALIGVIVGLIYQFQIAGPRDRQIAEQNELILRLTGLSNQAATNSLAARFTDADANLVADAPATDQQIDPSVLIFSYVPVEDHADFKTAFAPVLAAIAKATGKEVKYVEYTSTEDQLNALSSGELHIAGLNTGAVPIGVCVAGFVPQVMMADAAGTATYNMQLIVPAKSDIKTVDDLRGRMLTLTDPSSNSGCKAPLVLLRDLGLKPGFDYQTNYSFGHTASILGIKAGNFQCAAVAGDVLTRMISSGEISESDFRIIFTSQQSFPPAAIGVAHQLKPDLAAKIKAAFVSFDWKDTPLAKGFSDEGRAKFVTIDYQRDWDYVRRIDDALGASYALKPPSTQPATTQE